ncbi:hypothetical protein [Morganella morganii]|uniref:hypothetical protein n=1 Tax=Morganella morganii TaxID=582 RepID=UPI003BA02F27
MRKLILELTLKDSQNYREWLLVRDDWYSSFPVPHSDLTFSGCKIIPAQSSVISLMTHNIIPLRDYLLKENCDTESLRHAVILIMKSCYYSFRNSPPVIGSFRFKHFLTLIDEIYSFAFFHKMDIDDRNYIHAFKINNKSQTTEINPCIGEISDFISFSQISNMLHALPGALSFLARTNSIELIKDIAKNHLIPLLPVVSGAMKYCLEDYESYTSYLHQSRYIEHKFESGGVVVNFTALSFPLNPLGEIYEAIDTNVFISLHGSGYCFGWTVLRELATAVSFLSSKKRQGNDSNYKGKEVFIDFNADYNVGELTISSYRIETETKTLEQFVSGLDLFFKSDEIRIIFNQLSFYLGDL